MANVEKYAEIVTNHEFAQEEFNLMIAEIDNWILEETGSTLCYYLQELSAKLEKLRLVEDKVVDDLTRYYANELSQMSTDSNLRILHNLQEKLGDENI